MPGTWINRVKHVNDGEPVNGAVDSRPTRALEGNAQYLKNRIDSAEMGEGVIAYGETVEAAALIGMAVYRNSDPAHARYERALAAVESAIDPDGKPTGILVPSASSDTVGIIIFKYNATKADILLAGRHQVDISAAVDPTTLVNNIAPPGRYYLSSFTAGMLVQQRPPVSVSVLIYTDDGMAIVQPVQRDFLEDHIHYRVQLYAQPAGTNELDSSSGANRRVVGSPDATLPGWLPATSDFFDMTRVPAGAVFGYNLAQHPQLARIFPPIPPSGAVIFLDRADDLTGGKLIPMGPGGLCIVDSFGIWWMSDCNGDAPWPDGWPLPVDPGGEILPECPRVEEFQIILSYTMMVYTTERTAVTSLQPALPDGPLTFTDCDGAEATTGDLYAGLNLAFLVDPADDTAGWMAFKTFDAENETFERGPVVEGLTQGLNCTLASKTMGLALDGVTPLFQGQVQVNVSTTTGERELPADLIRMAQTDERYYLNVPYIGFDAGRDTSLRMRFYVPTDLSAGAQVVVRMQLLGRASGTLPNMSMTYLILKRPVTFNPPPAPPTPILQPLPQLTAEQPLTINTNVSVGADQYTEVNSAPIPVNAGDTILVMLSRSSADLYGGEVGLMRPVGILTVATLGT
jgi:hypothetical protein